ncbi:MAG: HPr-rel-A system PqqD family peptide chaperone [Rubrivivax sp.]|nr:HPr-rel-A system PqqD family peptide chaperone [Rubrivivax sp.]
MLFAPAPHIDAARWGGSCVIFDAESGNTHLLDEYASQILTILFEAREPLSQATIFSSLPAEARRTWEEADVAEVLDELVRMGIVAHQHA